MLSGSKAPRTTNEESEPILSVIDSANRGELVALIGTGVSMNLTDGQEPALSWKGLILNGFGYGEKKGKISTEQTRAWQAQLDSSDLDDLLAAAEFLGRKLGSPNGDLYARWIQKVFKHQRPTNGNMIHAVKRLHEAGIPLATLNYDSLVEQVTDLPPINLGEMSKVTSWIRQEGRGVLHLHGTWEVPSSCILGIRDYETTIGNEVRDLIQRTLATFRRLVFIGCGDTFSDPNFSALVRWLREHVGASTLEHYALVRNQDVISRQSDPTWLGFVEPIGYGDENRDLPTYIIKHFKAREEKAPQKQRSRTKTASSDLIHAKVLQDYCAFLVKDCGQMTIEGVRADMETAQRRFDLERLFVPTKLLPTPPEIPESDPRRNQIMGDWTAENKKPQGFGKVFKHHKRLALLAIPGGGKTLLLKRLAVAYADPARLSASIDGLPQLDVIPVLIRCREWREHIHRPILTLLNSISDITGQASLSRLSSALLPLFQKGRVLLLVDGLDEIHDDSSRLIFVENLESFLRDYSETRVVITSREAGFSLVAPSLSRFCDRWRIAPLETEGITALCDHWRSLMAGDSPEAFEESTDLAQTLVHNESLRRLAENPLLLTMLLVVKHGAGRLPPDRVSLYSRAVEVLLDTWNIKGHAPLNPKESVPQLASVAFQMMQAGKQTATRNELLSLLEEARDKVPQIRRYAKDTPEEFLNRVELRSSLVVEAGYQAEGNRTVPFYQFRHLTFQEYLAAVAAVEGHYVGYDKSDTVLSPLKKHLVSEEWKEVIPMSAVLARKQAQPVIGALVEEGILLRTAAKQRQDFEKNHDLPAFPPKLPAPIARLLQCFAEEAEAAPETVTDALQLIAFFARGCTSQDQWVELSRGPYGAELFHQAWKLYASMDWPPNFLFRNTCARIAAFQHTESYWASEEGKAYLLQLLANEDLEQAGHGLMTCCGIQYGRGPTLPQEILAEVERHLFHKDPSLLDPAVWAWALSRISRRSSMAGPSTVVEDRLLLSWLSESNFLLRDTIGFALTCVIDREREEWIPVISYKDASRVKSSWASWEDVEPSPHQQMTEATTYEAAAACTVAFYARTIWSDEELLLKLSKLLSAGFIAEDFTERMLKHFGEEGERILNAYNAQRHEQANGPESGTSEK